MSTAVKLVASVMRFLIRRDLFEGEVHKRNFLRNPEKKITKCKIAMNGSG